MSTRRWALALAIGATCTALCLSVLSGLQRGGSIPERLVWVALGLVLVTSAHLLPALLRDTPIRVRTVGGVLWAMCLATACVGHTVFFVMAQHDAGERRVSALTAEPISKSSRTLTAVMAERATVTALLAAANARFCAGNCVTLEGRRATLTAKADALNAEADDIRRQQIADDRVTTRRETLRADPVTSRLAALLGVPISRIDLLFGVLFAAVLEGVACLLWTVALRSPLPAVTEASASAVTDATYATQPVVTTSTASHIDGTANSETRTVSRGNTGRSHGPRIDSSTPLPTADPIDSHLTQLARDIAAGLVRPTVADIRRHLGCSQAKAATLRRQLSASKSTA